MNQVQRIFEAKVINEVVNHASVRPFVLAEVEGELDLTPIVQDEKNVLLMGEGGGLLFVYMEPGVYEVHTQFKEDYRGAAAVAATRAALEWMFTRTDAMELQTKVPLENKRALGLVRAIGGEHVFDGVFCRVDGEVSVGYWVLHYHRWLWSAQGLIEKGQWFHEELEKQKMEKKLSIVGHKLDLAHDRVVGAACLMITRGQVLKGIVLYNRWARFANYVPVRIVRTNPILLDILDCLLWIDGERFEVIPIPSSSPSPSPMAAIPEVMEI